MNVLARFLATGFLSGHSPVAPGTAGAILATFLYWLIPVHHFVACVSLVAVVFFVGVWSASSVERLSGVRDNQVIVIDEMVGVWVTLLGAPKETWVLLLGLGLFRLFDIWKPFPVKQGEKLSGGWGVMADDVLAGIYAFLLLRLILCFV